MSKSKKAAKAAMVIAALTLASKLLGFIREMLIGARFGSGMETDTFFIAMSATGLITGLISSAIGTTYIPILSEIEYKEGREGKINHTNNMINIVLFLSIILVLLGWLAAPWLVKILAKDFQDEQFNMTVRLTRIGLPKLLFSGIIGTLTGFLRSEERHISSAAIGFPANFVFIFLLIFLAGSFGIKGLMISSVIAVFSQLLIQLPEAKRAGFKYSFVFDIKDRYIKRTLYLSLPVFVGVAINDLNVIIDKNLASGLVEGSISALNYANKLNGLVLGVFISAITTAIFPLLSKESSSDNIPGMRKLMAYGINFILLITIPATVGLMVLANPIVEVAFQRGAFDATATRMTSLALVFYSIGLVAMALRLLLIRVYYSLQDTSTPVINSGISMVFNLILSLVLVKYMDHAGLALGTSIATSIATLIQLYGLEKKIGPLGIKGYIVTLVKATLASIIMGFVAYLSYHELYKLLGVSRLYNLISLLAAVGLSVIVYVLLCYLLRVKGLRDIMDRAMATGDRSQ